MEIKEESKLEGENRYRKFGLPNWMVNNIERLNFVTDFEQYACSPPETEGFLAENIDNCDFKDKSPSPIVILNEPAEDKPVLATGSKGITGSKSSPSLLGSQKDKVASPSIENIKHEEQLYYSSPDTTPCATPEPSPAPRRKMSGQQDTVQTNPGKWFYLGNFKKTDSNAKGQSSNITSNKENKMKHLDKSSEIPRKLKDSPVKQKKNGIKLVISNFDINAVSPSSW